MSIIKAFRVIHLFSYITSLVSTGDIWCKIEENSMSTRIYRTVRICAHLSSKEYKTANVLINVLRKKTMLKYILHTWDMYGKAEYICKHWNESRVDALLWAGGGCIIIVHSPPENVWNLKPWMPFPAFWAIHLYLLNLSSTTKKVNLTLSPSK
jgi:hypothetical protein